MIKTGEAARFLELRMLSDLPEVPYGIFFIHFLLFQKK
jgi:hypothetical protein